MMTLHRTAAQPLLPTDDSIQGCTVHMWDCNPNTLTRTLPPTDDSKSSSESMPSSIRRSSCRSRHAACCACRARFSIAAWVGCVSTAMWLRPISNSLSMSYSGVSARAPGAVGGFVRWGMLAARVGV